MYIYMFTIIIRLNKLDCSMSNMPLLKEHKEI